MFCRPHWKLLSRLALIVHTSGRQNPLRSTVDSAHSCFYLQIEKQHKLLTHHDTLYEWVMMGKVLRLVRSRCVIISQFLLGVTPYSSVHRCQHYGATCCLHSRDWLLKMDTVYSGMLVAVHKITWNHIPGHNVLRSQYQENVNSNAAFWFM
jgi:hypothetical protein